MWGNVASKKCLKEFNSQSLMMLWRRTYIPFSFLLNPLLARRLPGLHTVLFHTIVLGGFMEIRFRADSKISKFVAFLGCRYIYRSAAHNQAYSDAACIIDRRWRIVLSRLVSISIYRVHTCLLSCRKSKCSTPKVITVRYVITLCSVFAQTIEVGYPPSLLLLWTLAIVEW